MTPAPDPLEAALEALRRETPVQPESVRAEVWRRIALAEAAARLREPWWRRLEAAFVRPAFAVAFVAASLLLGLFLAEIRVSRLREARTVMLEREYLELLDPLASAPNLPRAQPRVSPP
jgi:hypothetical protein